MNRRFMYSVIMIGLLVSSIGVSGFAMERTFTSIVSPTPISTIEALNVFPHGLICSEVGVGDGPTWRGIIIGETTTNDLQEMLGAEKTITPYSNNMYRFELQDRHNATYPVLACIENEVVIVMQIAGLFDFLYIDDFVAMYGIPDAVTYTLGITGRAVFWFEEGITVTVFIQEGTNAYGRVENITFFPYQPIEGYEARWPYNRTVQDGIPSRDETISNEQNPFDFEVMIATITAQPSRTPTPTFTPQPTVTATPEITQAAE